MEDWRPEPPSRNRPGESLDKWGEKGLMKALKDGRVEKAVGGRTE